eukprot:6302107-Amphidinium_carterae.1
MIDQYMCALANPRRFANCMVRLSEPCLNKAFDVNIKLNSDRRAATEQHEGASSIVSCPNPPLSLLGRVLGALQLFRPIFDLF